MEIAGLISDSVLAGERVVSIGSEMDLVVHGENFVGTAGAEDLKAVLDINKKRFSLQ